MMLSVGVPTIANSIIERIGLYLLAPLPGGTVMLSLESGNLLHLDADMTEVARTVAKGSSVNDTVALAAERLKVPRYVARERVRSLHIRLDGDAPNEDLRRFGIRATSCLKVHHLGELPAARASVQAIGIATNRGRLLLQGESAEFAANAFRAVGERISDGGPHFDTLGLHELGHQSVSWGSIDQVWFVRNDTNAIGFTMSGLPHDLAFMRMMSAMRSEHNPREWLKLFDATAVLFAGARAYEVITPKERGALELAVHAFTNASMTIAKA
jgi:hypothetical protein